MASHDFFGSSSVPHTFASVFASDDQGATWAFQSNVTSMYWATLFTRANDSAVYLLGVQCDGTSDCEGKYNQISIAESLDGGMTWSRGVNLTSDAEWSYSTGPTPILPWGGRLWRAYEHNVGPAWGSGYASRVISAPLDAAVNLLEPASWTLSGELPWSAVSGRVPPSWNKNTSAIAVPNLGWLEGGVLPPLHQSEAGIRILLRVNSEPSANKAALLSLASPTAIPAFVGFVDPFPGGMSKFSVRRDDAVTGLYVTLSNAVADESVTWPPACGPIKGAPAGPLPCCGFIDSCAATAADLKCVWCHASSRNVLTLAVAPDAAGPWRTLSTILYDDTGVSSFISLLGTGFQYVDWQFDGKEDIIALVRAGYRGSNNYHNSNRILIKTIVNWRQYIASSGVDGAH